MKRLFLVSIFLIAFQRTEAQKYQMSLPSYISSNLNDDPFLIKAIQTPANIRDATLVPENHTDSTFDGNNGIWFYKYDVFHQYHAENCRDSVITYSENGGLTERSFLNWDSTAIYQTYRLSQDWNGSDWVDDYEIESPVQYGCYSDYLVHRHWNGSSWDTVYATKEELVFDTYNRIAERHYYRYENHQWETYRRVFPYYGINDIVISMADFEYSTSSGQLISGVRDTNYSWVYFNSFCSSLPLEYISQVYDTALHVWINSTKYQLTEKEIIGTDTLYHSLISEWNGAGYDSSVLYYNKFDVNGRFIEYNEQVYDSSAHAWVLAYYTQRKYTYGTSNEILRNEYLTSYCGLNYEGGSCHVDVYGNFISCGVATGSAQFSLDEELALYPNPVNDLLFVRLSSDLSNQVVRVYDLYGREISIQGYFQGNTAQLNTAGLPKGVYVIVIGENEDGARIHANFIKN